MKRMVPIYIYNQLEQAKELIKDMSSPNKGEKACIVHIMVGVGRWSTLFTIDIEFFFFFGLIPFHVVPASFLLPQNLFSEPSEDGLSSSLFE